MIDRARLGRMFGAAGSAHDNERLSALRAIDIALAAAGLSWSWVVDIIANGAHQSEARERLFHRLVFDSLTAAYASQWGLTAAERAILGRVNSVIAAGGTVRDADDEELISAIEVCDALKRRNTPGPARVNWR